jgi:ubiquinone/menaquinone biosynthesis C-methylase UbiE
MTDRPVTSSALPGVRDSVANEARRLQLQGLVYEPLTRRFFEEAGIRPGMRVVDIGSGAGDVSLLLADLVGSTGDVLGIEHNAELIAVAADRTCGVGSNNVRFVHARAESILLDRQVDAVVGRFVLRELKDPVRFLTNVRALIDPGGIVAFQEKVLAVPVVTVPPIPLIDRIQSWLHAARTAAGVELAIGAKLPQLFRRAGLVPSLRVDAPIGAGSDWLGYEYLAATVRGMLPLLALYNIADEHEVNVDDLADRLRAAAGTDGTVILPPCVGAWATCSV